MLTMWYDFVCVKIDEMGMGGNEWWGKMSILTGKEFNEKYGDKKFVKLTNESENHNGYQFQTGLNVDTVEFNPKGSCQPGGIYFCELGKLSKWLEYYYQKMVYGRSVSIPEDAEVYEEEDKWKADRLVLGEREEIGELGVWDDEKYCLEAVKENGSALKYVKDQTEEMCMKAVRENGYALQFVKNQTENVCMEAVRQNGYALEYVRDQTEAICMAAVKGNGYALEYVSDQTKEICMAAVRQNSNALRYVKIKVYSRK